MNSRLASRLASWLVAIALVSDAFVAPAGIATAATAPGTQITNNATATYKDAASNVYNTTSNTVTTVVENAPTLTFTAATGAAYSPGQGVIDTFTITNTGNASGTFQINGNNTVDGSGAFSSAADAVLGGTDATNATLGVGGPASNANCTGSSGTATYVVTVLPGPTVANCDTLAHANAFLLAHSIVGGGVANSVVTVSVYYTLNAPPASIIAPGTITSSLYANVSYAAVSAGGGLAAAPAEVSAVTAIATESNTVIADANINQYKASIQCTVSPCTTNVPALPAGDTLGDVQYTISANNSGSQPTKDLKSVKALLNLTSSAFNTACGACTGGVL
ncbi:MAG TPA: hypothetical protein VIJ12_05940, partial [Candidatus Baltobacteraceae bacterium]